MPQPTFPKIAVASEGVTDRLFLERLLVSYYKLSNFKLYPLFPEESEDRSKDPKPAGWSNLKKYLGSDDFETNCLTRDIIIIQIDTDVCSDYGVQYESNVEDMICNTIKKLIEWITPERYDRLKKKIVFAVCVNSMECWLLPFYVERSDAAKRGRATEGCIRIINKFLTDEYKMYIDGIKEPVYKRIVQDKQRFKPKTIEGNTPRNPSLHIFWQVLVGKIEAHLAA